MASWDVSPEDIEKVKSTLNWDTIDWDKYQKIAKDIDEGVIDYDVNMPWEVIAARENWGPEDYVNMWKYATDAPISEMPSTFASAVNPVDIQFDTITKLPKDLTKEKELRNLYESKLVELRGAQDQLSKWYESRKSGAIDIYQGKSAKAGENPLVNKVMQLESEAYKINQNIANPTELITKSDYRKIAPTKVPINTLKFGLGAIPIAGAFLEPDIASAAMGEVIPGGVDEAGRGSDTPNSPESEFDLRYSDYLKKLRRK
jgi:hypothetical protein